MSSAVEIIKQLAYTAGFDAVGIVKPSSLEEGERALADWVAEGRHGSMKYLEEFRQRRERFERDFGEIKSLIVLGVNYYSHSGQRSASSSQENPNTDDLTLNAERSVFSGRIARYAWGRDYHEVIQRRHEELIAAMRTKLGYEFKAKSCVDTQPVAERYAAMMAGFGFTGKHTGILNAQFGPWLFLSEIAVNLNLPEDVPKPGTCGSCQHCQTACPTGALDEDYRMDARRCIAYLTIEHKGTIPKEFRPHVKDWIFGCDECLVVCPFTSKSQETQWKELLPEAGIGMRLDLDELFAIQSNGDYEKRFRGTALLRTGRKQMMRNACLVLGNSEDSHAVPYLIRALQDPAPLVRQHAAWGLGRFSTTEAKEALSDRLKAEQDTGVSEEIRDALQAKGSNPAFS